MKQKKKFFFLLTKEAKNAGRWPWPLHMASPGPDGTLRLLHILHLAPLLPSFLPLGGEGAAGLRLCFLPTLLLQKSPLMDGPQELNGIDNSSSLSAEPSFEI